MLRVQGAEHSMRWSMLQLAVLPNLHAQETCSWGTSFPLLVT